MKSPTIYLHPKDNVIVALVDIPRGASIPHADLMTRDPIPSGHKIATQPISVGQPVFKYGQAIGFAAEDIEPGQTVHTHNLILKDIERDYAFSTDSQPIVENKASETHTFDGIVRPDGRVATRNFIGILTTVNCSASVGHFIADAIDTETLAKYPNVDGVVALGHGTGCCLTPDEQGFILLQRTLQGYARHPNFGAILLVGLGCEGNNIDCLVGNTGLSSGPYFKTLNIQTEGGTPPSVAKGIKIVHQMLPQVNQVRRQPVSAKHIILGLECGGSDAYSGITANPALGAAVDHLVSMGGTAVLSETPEIYGAEHLLIKRAVSRQVGEKLVERIKWWKNYTRKHGGEINNNPSPGNKAGGITTILEKSLGAVTKGGSSPLQAVYEYAQPVRAQGLVFMDTPGYDVASITGMTAGGINVVCFTTGRGTVCGFKPVPTIKLASNSQIYRHMQADMDINCGRIVDEQMSVQEMGDDILQSILDIASGRKTKSEGLGFGDHEFVPWHIGAIL